jgi:hypothetical protein
VSSADLTGVKKLAPLAVVAALLLATPRPAHAETARSADAFVGSIGVNTHVIYDDTAYGNFDLLRSRLQELGVRHIRDGVCGACGWQQDRFAALAGDGIKLDAGLGSPGDSAATVATNLAAVGRLGSMVDAVEGANEWDLFSGHTATWSSEDRAYQQRVWSATQANAALRGVPVIGPSLVFSWESPSSWDDLGSLTSQLTYGNIHSYPGGLPPEATLAQNLSLARQISGSRPVVATETGYHNALSQSNWGHPAVPEDVAGAYIPRMFLENFRLGVVRTYAYELLDEWPGQAATNMEASFGLLRSDFSRKPAYVSVRNLIAALRDPGAPLAPAEVPLTLSGGTADVDHLTLRKRSGEVDVVLWRSASLWDRDARRTLVVAPTSVRVTLGSRAFAAQLVKPAGSATPSPVALRQGAATVSVGASPIVLELLASSKTKSAKVDHRDVGAHRETYVSGVRTP